MTTENKWYGHAAAISRSAMEVEAQRLEALIVGEISRKNIQRIKNGVGEIDQMEDRDLRNYIDLLNRSVAKQNAA